MIARLFSAGLMAVLCGGAAPAQSLEPFEVARAEDWAQALALCDLTRFVQSEPKLDADVILTRDDGTGQFRPLYGPRFMPPNLFYDGEVKRAFFRLERAGEVNRRSVSAARFALDRPMLRTFRRIGAAERRFLDDQSETCSALLTDVRARYR